MTANIPQLTTIRVELTGHVAELRLNRPERSNAINAPMWQELRAAVNWADAEPEVRVVVLAAEGRNLIHFKFPYPRDREALRREIQNPTAMPKGRLTASPMSSDHFSPNRRSPSQYSE